MNKFTVISFLLLVTTVVFAILFFTKKTKHCTRKLPVNFKPDDWVYVAVLAGGGFYVKYGLEPVELKTVGNDLHFSAYHTIHGERPANPHVYILTGAASSATSGKATVTGIGGGPFTWVKDLFDGGISITGSESGLTTGIVKHKAYTKVCSLNEYAFPNTVEDLYFSSKLVK